MTVSSFPLDLRTLNEVQSVVVREIRHQVCQWEQDSLDAAAAGDFRSAQMLKDWAFAADLLAHKVGGSCTALFLDTCNTFPLVEDQRTVKLPELNRTAQDLRLDALALEVVSEMPSPTA